jgi:hypothetical protein
MKLMSLCPCEIRSAGLVSWNLNQLQVAKKLQDATECGPNAALGDQHQLAGALARLLELVRLGMGNRWKKGHLRVYQ